MSAIESDKDVAKKLYNALKEDTSQVQVISADSLYSVQLNSGKDLISAGSFEEMKLKDGLLEGLFKLGYEKPTIIQDIAIPQILRGGDVVFHSKSGTGKTVAFSLGALQQVEQGKGPQVVVLTPTRELSNQVGEVIATFGKFVNISVCFALRNFVADSISEEVVVGSPGKILGLLNSKIIDGSSIKVLVLDEADELISQQSFSAQTIRLVKALSNAQKIFFSATYSDFSQQSVKKLLPKCDTFFEKNQKADKIQLYYVEIDKTTKIAALKTLFGLLTVAQTIVFVATRRMVDVVSKELVTDGFSVSKIHGELDPIERDGAFRDFYQAKTKVLVSTDLFSRGMDIPQVNLIINFDLPSDTHKKMDETYIHRVGRSGRFDRSGFVIDFITGEDDLRALAHIQSHNGTISQRFTMEALQEVFSEDDLTGV